MNDNNGINKTFVRVAHAKRRALSPNPASSPVPTPEPTTIRVGTEFEREDQEQRNVDLATRWIGGFAVEGADGLLERVYLTGSAEAEARSALAQLLWDGTQPPDILKLLAMSIAPDGHELADSELRLSFSRRRRGNKGNRSAALQIALVVNEDVKAGRPVEDGIARAMARFRRSKRFVQSCWAENKSLLQGFGEARDGETK